jgi:catechol 2,3-dioxygenase-like lactoylglutathione lyase family enzyme
MINGAHVLIYSQDANADRAFLRDVLGFANVDAGDGWLIFKLPPAEVAVHPTDGPPRHELSLMCDDVQTTLAALTARGVEVSPVTSVGWGSRASVRLPSGAELVLYQPRHPVAYDLDLDG